MGGRDVAISATLVLLLAAAVSALFPTIYEHDSQNIVEVKQSWFPKNCVRVNKKK